MSLNRVVITGRGAVSPFGKGVGSLLDNIWAGNSAMRQMEEWEEIQGLTSRVAAPVPQLDVKKLLPRAVRRTMGKMAIYATLAAMEGVEDAGISQEFLSSGDIGVAIGSTTGSPAAFESFYASYLPKKRLEHIKSGEFFKMMSHSCSANVCLALNICGEQWGTASACTSSSQAIGLGYLLVKSGRQQAMLCGGADEVHASVTGIFDLLRAASNGGHIPEVACRPFDEKRCGVVCGGGSGILVLESLDSARRRGASIFAEIIGFGNVNDSGHIANPDEKTMIRAMHQALAEGGVTPSEIDYVNAHATGTELGDIAEAVAISRAVSGKTPVSSIKGHIGHTLGAAGGLELIVTLEMMRRGEIIPTRNLESIDPRCGVARLETILRKAPASTVLKNNFALGGVNTSLLLRSIDA